MHSPAPSGSNIFTPSRSSNREGPLQKALHRFPTVDLLCSFFDDSSEVDSPRSLSDATNVARLFQPFDGCDLILRATKMQPHTDFYVDRETVYSHSSYLKRKLSELTPTPPEIEIVAWGEDARILDAMLRFVYADRPKPQVQDIAELRVLLKAARTYGIEAANHALGTAVLLDFAKKDPVCAFTIACEFGLVDEAGLISKDTLGIDIMTPESGLELGRVSLSYYHRLYRLHKKRAERAINIIKLINPEHPMCEFDPPSCRSCGTNASWWQIFVEYGSIELKHRPTTAKIFSAAFLAKCVRTAQLICDGCQDSYLSVYSQKLLAQLKEDIDALPAYIASVDQFVTD